jgi:hypothetical protein
MEEKLSIHNNPLTRQVRGLLSRFKQANYPHPRSH